MQGTKWYKWFGWPTNREVGYTQQSKQTMDKNLDTIKHTTNTKPWARIGNELKLMDCI